MANQHSTIHESEHVFSLLHFIRFLEDRRVISIAIASVLSAKIGDVLNSFIDGMIMPFINRDADKDGVSDIKKLDDLEVNVGDVTLKVGPVITDTIKFVIITYLIFLFSKLIQKWVNRITDDD